MYFVYTCTFSCGKPVTFAASLRAAVCPCVEAQTSQPSGFTHAVQLSGSIGACARYGTSYTASIFLLAEASAASTSPVFFCTAPGCLHCSANVCEISGVLWADTGPSSHFTVSARRPSIADHVLSATTASPVEIGTTSLTPGTDLAFVASKLAAFPPKTGQRAATANNIPGSFTSIPNTALPSTLPGVSRRLVALPISRNCDGSFKLTFDGGVSFEAASASAPKLNRAFVAVLVTAPAAARQSDFCTPHFCAAASTSISRAVAPARRSDSQDVRMLMLPTTPWFGPYSRLTPGNSVRIFVQLHSSSSASSIASEVTVPCPISA